MAQRKEDEDIQQLISSIITCAMYEVEVPESAAPLRQGAASLPSTQGPRPQPEEPQQARSWEDLALNDQFWQNIKETQRMMSTRPKIKVPKPARRRERMSAWRKVAPLRVSRGTQTMALAIKDFPEETNTFPIPWGRRLRSVSVGTQTEDTSFSVVRGHETVPSWDPLPEEVFAMDDYAEWSSESSFENPRRNLSSSRYADTTFLNIDYDEGSLAALSDLSSCLPMLQRRAGTAQGEALQPGTDVEVVDYSPILQVRTVATNTVHVGWRRPQRFYRNRVLSRSAALGWDSNPDTATVATQTTPQKFYT